MTDLAETYGIPGDLMAFVNVGVLEVLAEKPEERTIEFHIPSMREHDPEGRITSYALTWIHPAFNAEFCHQYEKQRGDLPNFELLRDVEDVGDFSEPLDSVEALVTWLGGASEGVRRRKAGNPRPTPEELADAFSAVLNSQLPPETIGEINRRNADGDSECCATHEFCDAEQVMVDAMWTFGMHVAPEVEILNLIQDAWGLAKERGFATTETVHH